MQFSFLFWEWWSNVEQILQIKLNNTLLSYSDHGTSLMLIMDFKLRFREHVTHKLRVAYGNLKLIYSYRHYLSYNTEKMHCGTLIISHIQFCSSKYMPCSDKMDQYRVRKIQNSCLRLILELGEEIYISPALSQSGCIWPVYILKWSNIDNLLSSSRTFNSVRM